MTSIPADSFESPCRSCGAGDGTVAIVHDYGDISECPCACRWRFSHGDVRNVEGCARVSMTHQDCAARLEIWIYAIEILIDICVLRSMTLPATSGTAHHVDRTHKSERGSGEGGRPASQT